MAPPRPENGVVGCLLITNTVIISWWIAQYAHSHLPQAKTTSNGDTGNYLNNK